jgi:uncharacterized membrane protein
MAATPPGSDPAGASPAGPPAPTTSRPAHVGRYVFIGAITLAPLWVTWFVIDFVVGYLSRAGRPSVQALAGIVRPWSAEAADWLLGPVFGYLLAAAITVLGLYLLGWATTFVVGRRLIETFESLLARIPLARSIYGATQRLIEAMREQPTGSRVVLIRFPSDDMLTVGLVTRILKDADTGRDVAAIYVPTSPNPTSGYIELVATDRLIETDWTVEEAMRFVMTGGTSAPLTTRFGDLTTRGR